MTSLINEEVKIFKPESIGLDKRYNKVLYLQELCYKYGDFKITTSLRDNEDNKTFWKHRSILECWEDEKKTYFIECATHRTSFSTEIILDMDDNITLERFNLICDNIKYKYLLKYFGYFSGSKGYHIHIMLKDFLKHNKKDREIIRETIMLRFGMDLAKKSESSMIALEGCPHWKTGNIKTLIRCYK